MLVKCKHYSVTYPDGGHRIGDIFDLSKASADYYVGLGWVEILPDALQPDVNKKRGRKIKAENKPAVDLSKSEHDGRNLQHVFK